MRQKVLDNKLSELKSRIEPKTYKNNANDVSTRLSNFIYEKYVSEMEEGLKKDDFNVDNYCFKYIYPVALTKSEVAFLVDNNKLNLKPTLNQDKLNMPLLSLSALFLRKLGITLELRVIGYRFDESSDELFYVQAVLNKEYFVKPYSIPKGYTIEVRKRTEKLSSFQNMSGEFVYPGFLIKDRFKDFHTRIINEEFTKPLVNREENDMPPKTVSFFTSADWVKLIVIIMIGTFFALKLGLLF